MENLWDLFAGVALAKPSRPQDCANRSTTQGETSPLSSCGPSMTSSQSGSCGRMCLELSAPKEIPLAVSWRDWLAMIPQSHLLVENGQAVGFSLQKTKNPIPWPGESWMPNTSEFPNDAVESSLSDILDVDNGGSLAKYYLSEQAKAGILRRAEKRGKKLPPMLEYALRQFTQEQ